MNVDLSLLRIYEPNPFATGGKIIAHPAIHLARGVRWRNHFNREIRPAFRETPRRQFPLCPDKSDVRKTDCVFKELKRLLGYDRAKFTPVNKRSQNYKQCVTNMIVKKCSRRYFPHFSVDKFTPPVHRFEDWHEIFYRQKRFSRQAHFHPSRLATEVICPTWCRPCQAYMARLRSSVIGPFSGWLNVLPKSSALIVLSKTTQR